jgi:nanoRNase/pAp phosphatase (c-di-AMP/oligoRNAs hydrolase)
MSGVDAAANAPMGNGASTSSSADADPIAAILQVLRKGARFLVCSHARSDGDAVGSALALGMLLRQMGKRADLASATRIPDLYRRLPGADSIRTALRVQGPYDAAILLRVSLRSKDELNVAAIAARLGGGGHENAAGCTLDGPLRRAIHQILGELRSALAGFAAVSA